MTSQFIASNISAFVPVLLTKVDLSNESTSAIIDNLDKIISIVVVTLIPLIAKIVTGIIHSFTPEKQLPKSLYFTQSFDSRQKGKNAKKREDYLVIILASIAAFIFFFSIALKIGVDSINGFVSILTIVTVVLLVIFFVVWLIISSSQAKLIGKSDKSRICGRLAFLAYFFTVFNMVYMFMSTVVNNLINYQKLKHLDLDALKAANPNFDKSEVENVLNSINPSQLYGDLAIVLGMAIVFIFAAILIYSNILSSEDKEEYISLGYVMEGNKPLFIHYLEDDNYICSNSAYYSESGNVIIHDKSWIQKSKKVYLIDSSLHGQITDLYNYHSKLQTLPTLSDINKALDEESLIEKGQYKKLTDDEAAKLNEYMRYHLNADKEKKAVEKRQKKAQEQLKKKIKKQSKQLANARKIKSKKRNNPTGKKAS